MNRLMNVFLFVLFLQGSVFTAHAATPKTIQLQIDLNMILQPISPKSNLDITANNINLKVLNVKDQRFYAILPDAITAIQELSKNPRYSLSIYTELYPDPVADLLGLLNLDPKAVKILPGRVSAAAAALSANVIALVAESGGRFQDYDFFESYSNVPPGVVSEFFPQDEQLWRWSVFRWKAILAALKDPKILKTAGSADGKARLNLFDEARIAYLQQNDESLQRLSTRRFWLNYFVPKITNAKIESCQQMDTLTDAPLQEVSVDLCMEFPAKIQYAWLDTEQKTCGQFYDGFLAYPAVDPKNCIVGFAYLNEGAERYLISTLKLYPQNTICPNPGLPSYKDNNGPVKTENGLCLPRTGYTLYRGVEHNYVNDHMNEFALMLFGATDHFITSKGFVSRGQSDKDFVENQKARTGVSVIADVPESIYFSIYPDTARRYGNVMFMVEDIYRRGLDLNYARRCLGGSADARGEVSIPCYITSPELVGLYIHGEYAVRITENKRNYVLLYKGYDCLVRIKEHVFACETNHDGDDEYTIPLRVKDEAKAVGVISICESGNCTLPPGFFAAHNVVSKAGNFSNIDKIINDEVKKKLKPRTLEVAYP